MRARVTAGLKRLARRLAGRSDPIILMYHRVAQAPVDPWGLAVAPDVFDAQMKVLAETRRPVSLDWLADELRAGRRPKGAVAVTFDDAYRDVLQNAKPSLMRHGVPATVFVVSGAIGSESGYWWDQLAEVVLGAEALPARLDLPFDAPDAEAARASGRSERLHLALWGAVRLLAPTEREAAVAAIAAVFSAPLPASAPVMTEAELRSLGAEGLVTLGVHTVSHPSLPSLGLEAQLEEIAGCKAEVERITGVANRRLAYPFGDFNDQSLEVAEALGFDYALSVNTGPANDWRLRFQLPRYDVKNWPEAEFRRRLRWLG